MDPFSRANFQHYRPEGIQFTVKNSEHKHRQFTWLIFEWTTFRGGMKLKSVINISQSSRAISRKVEENCLNFISIFFFFLLCFLFACFWNATHNVNRENNNNKPQPDPEARSACYFHVTLDAKWLPEDATPVVCGNLPIMGSNFKRNSNLEFPIKSYYTTHSSGEWEGKGVPMTRSEVWIWHFLLSESVAF